MRGIAIACTIALTGIKFFYQHTLHRDWPTLELIRPPREKKLPVVLSVAEVQSVLNCLHTLRYRVCLSTMVRLRSPQVYACGLRLQEGVGLQVGDIDSGRHVLHVRGGKGNKDRYVPLPERTLVHPFEGVGHFTRTFLNPQVGLHLGTVLGATDRRRLSSTLDYAAAADLNRRRSAAHRAASILNR